MVRRNRERMTEDALCELFCLTPDGLRAIMGGRDWMPSHSSHPDDVCTLQPRTRTADGLRRPRFVR